MAPVHLFIVGLRFQNDPDCADVVLCLGTPDRAFTYLSEGEANQAACRFFLDPITGEVSRDMLVYEILGLTGVGL